jgi:hypothetical protein
MYRDTNVEHEKCKIIPVIIGTNGIATNGLKKRLEDIPGKYSIDSLQKIAIPGKSHIIQNVLLSGEDHRWFKRSTREKRPMTRDNNSNKNIIIIIIIIIIMFFFPLWR